MNVFVLANASTGTVVADRLERPRSWIARSRGLIGRADLRAGTGLWLDRCWGIHTVGMRFALDVLFLSDEFRIVGFECNVRPGRLAIVNGRSTHVIELRAGTLSIADLLAGDRMRLFEA